MAKRTLEALQKQYARDVKDRPRHGPGPGPRGRDLPGNTKKPRHTKQTIARIFGYIGKYKINLVFVFLLMIASTVTSLIGSYMMSPIINRIQMVVAPELEVKWTPIGIVVDGILSKITDSGVFSALISQAKYGQFFEIALYVASALIVLTCVYLIGIIATWAQARLMLQTSQAATEKIRNDLFTKLQTLPIRYFDQNTTGEIMSRFTNDVDNIDIMLNNTLTSVVSGFITLIGTFIFMITTNVILTVVTIAFVPILSFVGSMIAKYSSKYYAKQQAALGAVNGYIEESVTGQKVVKVFNHEKTCVEEFDMLNSDLRQQQFSAQFYGGIMGPVMGNTTQICYAVTVGVGGVLMFTSGLGAGDVTVFAQYSRQFSQPINNISQQMSTIFAALAGAERVFNIMDMEPEDLGKGLKSRVDGEVVFDDVTFGYYPEKTVLKHINLYAHKGQKIAFVGSTGAGKTTVTNLINRFYDIEEGKITIDGVDVKDYDKEWLRKNIAMVLQDTHLFTGTVMENIRYGRLDATDEEVIEAAKTASAHSFIMRLNDGYNTILEGDGANLSQGQRQLLNIARAALSKAPILVLDEATSSVDTRTEKHIEHGMDRLMKNRTTFVIAHRLSTVRNANAIMVLEAGEIIERGTHEQLLDMKGRYYELYTGKKELD
ncbi:MAG: ABC transporter ATP-binding protein/permease [Clostridia bacterium]|nr:ABC transporter ATP-binding protein/permease [Clostridia bacterium]